MIKNATENAEIIANKLSVRVNRQNALVMRLSKRERSITALAQNVNFRPANIRAAMAANVNKFDNKR